MNSNLYGPFFLKQIAHLEKRISSAESRWTSFPKSIQNKDECLKEMRIQLQKQASFSKIKKKNEAFSKMVNSLPQALIQAYDLDKLLETYEAALEKYIEKVAEQMNEIERLVRKVDDDYLSDMKVLEKKAGELKQGKGRLNEIQAAVSVEGKAEFERTPKKGKKNRGKQSRALGGVGSIKEVGELLDAVISKVDDCIEAASQRVNVSYQALKDMYQNAFLFTEEIDGYEKAYQDFSEELKVLIQNKGAENFQRAIPDLKDENNIDILIRIYQVECKRTGKKPASQRGWRIVLLVALFAMFSGGMSALTYFYFTSHIKLEIFIASLTLMGSSYLSLFMGAAMRVLRVNQDSSLVTSSHLKKTGPTGSVAPASSSSDPARDPWNPGFSTI